jgi:hypothetical protein
VRRIQIPGEIADARAETLRTSQGDKERFHRTAAMQLQQRYLSSDSNQNVRITTNSAVRATGISRRFAGVRVAIALFPACMTKKTRMVVQPDGDGWRMLSCAKRALSRQQCGNASTIGRFVQLRNGNPVSRQTRS